MRPGEIRFREFPTHTLTWLEVGEEIPVDCGDIRGEMGFVEDPTKKLFWVVPDVALGGLRFCRLRMFGEFEDGVHHFHQELVKALLRDTAVVALITIFPPAMIKVVVSLDLQDCRLPFGLPVVGDVQDVLHEVLDADKNAVVYEILSDRLDVVGTVVFPSAIRLCLEI